MPTIHTGHGDFHVAIDGPEGAPWLVLSNALGATLDMWLPQVEDLRGSLRLLRYDTRGHGRSCVPPGPYTIDDLGGDVLRLMDALRIERAHFCGLSMGGTTGIWLGAHAPGRIDRLVLCNTAAWFGPPEVMDARIAAVRRSGMTAVVEGVLARWFTPDFHDSQPAVVQRIRADLLATPVEGYVACCAALRDLDERPSLARIRAPTLVVGGTHDPAPAPAAIRALAAQLPGAQYLELPAAHLGNLGAPRAFSAALRAHLAAGRAPRA